MYHCAVLIISATYLVGAACTNKILVTAASVLHMFV
jgi:hypothetical protein